jgi:hypothetical protein
VPFDFLKRKKEVSELDAATGAAGGSGVRGVTFDGLTDEWRIVGEMHIAARLSDALNKREAVTISDVRWAPVDGSGELAPASGLKAIDPYDLILVLAGAATLPPLTDAERTAYKVHKIPYDVALEVPPFRVIGTVYMSPGTQPDRLLDRGTEMFFPVVGATAFLGETQLVAELDAILVNRFYLRGLEQIDRRTGERPQPLPGMPLGGTSWHDRSR